MESTAQAGRMGNPSQEIEGLQIPSGALPTFPNSPGKIVFDRQKTGIFVPQFDPREFERVSTMLNEPQTRGFVSHPDRRIPKAEREFQREVSLIGSLSERENANVGPRRHPHD